jgi:hypothetical protein
MEKTLTQPPSMLVLFLIEKGAALAAPCVFFPLILEADLDNGAIGNLAHLKLAGVAFDQL